MLTKSEKKLLLEKTKAALDAMFNAGLESLGYEREETRKANAAEAVLLQFIKEDL